MFIINYVRSSIYHQFCHLTIYQINIELSNTMTIYIIQNYLDFTHLSEKKQYEMIFLEIILCQIKVYQKYPTHKIATSKVMYIIKQASNI